MIYTNARKKGSKLWKENLLPILICLLFSNQISASVSPPLPSIFDQMHYQEVLPVTIEVAFDSLRKDHRIRGRLDAVISFTDKQGVPQTWNAEISQRGKFRRKHCEDMPPLKIYFSKDDLSAAGLASFNDMKIVTQCVTNAKSAKSLLLKEYLAYKLYNQVSIVSYRVQILEINFKDIFSGEITKQWAFMLEDTGQLRHRIGATKAKDNFQLSPDYFDRDQVRTMAIFQYMIGNADYSLAYDRNVKMMMKDGKRIAIPFDFDFAGIVNAPYAIPNPNYGLKSTKERVYLGFEKKEAELKADLKRFAKLRKILIKEIQNFKLLNSRDRREVADYIDDFFYNADSIRFGKLKSSSAKK